MKDPEPTFSACFGGPFLVWHPTKYAELLAEKLRKHGAQTWLVNTGWSGGAYGVGSRIKLRYTRAIIDAIHNGTLLAAPTVEDPIFGFAVPTACAEVPSEILVPRNTWAGQGRVRREGQEGRAAVPRELQEVRGAGLRGSSRGRPEGLSFRRGRRAVLAPAGTA